MSEAADPWKVLASIAQEARAANSVIAMKRDETGSGRVKVATAMHRIERMARQVLAARSTQGDQ